MALVVSGQDALLPEDTQPTETNTDPEPETEAETEADTTVVDPLPQDTVVDVIDTTSPPNEESLDNLNQGSGMLGED